jgi:hypothetical protein
MNTLIDCFELPLPAIETYRAPLTRYRTVPMQSLDLSIDFEDTAETDAAAPPPSDRLLRTRSWGSEEP